MLMNLKIHYVQFAVCTQLYIILKTVYCSCMDPTVFELFVQFCGLVEFRWCPCCHCPHLCGASFTALRKKSGSLCPIAVSEVIHLLTSKCIALCISSDFLSRTVYVLSPQ